MDLYVINIKARWALRLHTFCRMRRKLILEKKFRHEKFVIGSDGRAVVGMPSSSTDGGIIGSAGGGFSPSSLRRRMGGGAASSSSDEDEESLLDGEGGSS